jgi:hypothetical protein
MTVESIVFKQLHWPWQSIQTDYDQQSQWNDDTRMFNYWMLNGGLRFVIVVDVVCALFLLRSFCFCYVLSYFFILILIF